MRKFVLIGCFLICLLGLSFASSAHAQYVVTYLVSDGGVPAARTDPNLVNGWGVARGSSGPFFVAATETAKGLLYDGNGNPPNNHSVITIPPATAGPTGVAFNGDGEFMIRQGPNLRTARFLIASEDGTISGWTPQLNPTQAIVAVNTGGESNYKGIALGIGAPTGHFQRLLYATDFKEGEVAVYDSSFHYITDFTDETLPAGYVPFGIRRFAGQLVVTFALSDADGHDDVPGPGHGYVDVFNTSGQFLYRLHSGGPLNSPWGIAKAPSDFGPFSNKVLIGNFGDGRINAFEMNGTFLGPLRDTNGDPIEIDGLWGLEFGNGNGAGYTNVLYFAAGPDDEEHGSFGKIALD